MADRFGEAREFLTRSVRTNRRDFESYMNEMAQLNSRAHTEDVDIATYVNPTEEVDRRYGNLLHEEDCHVFETARDYRAFLRLLKKVAPTFKSDLDGAFSHETEHAAALESMPQVKLSFCYWLLREEDGSVSGWPCIQVRACPGDYLEARHRAVVASSTPSPHDLMETGRGDNRQVFPGN